MQKEVKEGIKAVKKVELRRLRREIECPRMEGRIGFRT